MDLGDLMFSLCYLPTAGRLTITVIKARNLKAMDITGASGIYIELGYLLWILGLKEIVFFLLYKFFFTSLVSF